MMNITCKDHPDTLHTEDFYHDIPASTDKLYIISRVPHKKNELITQLQVRVHIQVPNLYQKP